MEKLVKIDLIFKLFIKNYQLNRHMKYLKFAEDFLTKSRKVENDVSIKSKKKNIQQKLVEK